MLRQFLLEIFREDWGEPGGQVGLHRDDIEKDQAVADEFSYEWPVRHGFEGQVRGALNEEG